MKASERSPLRNRNRIAAALAAMTKHQENPSTVLIVNDDQKALDLLVDLLAPEGYKVLTAQSARRALEITSAVRTDLIICDVVMPEMSGLELCRRLKKDPLTTTTPVLMASAVRKEDAAHLDGFAAGADDYIEIPFRHEQLLVKVARLIERHRVERRYRDIVECAADIIYTRDIDGRITSINEAGARFFGRPAFDLIGQPLSALIGDDAAARDIAEMQNLKSFEPVRFTQCLKNALGEQRYLEGIVTLDRDSAGQCLGVRGVVRDVTERQHAEAALQKQNEEYRILFESNPCPMYLCDESTLRFLAVNEAAIQHYGYSSEEFLRMNARDIRPDAEVPALASYVAANTAREGDAGVWKHRKKDGTVIDAQVNWHKVDFAGRPAYLVLAKDVTEQKQAEVAVRESEERYRELFENANDIVYTHDLTGRFTSLNKSGEHVTGYTLDEALRMNIADVLAPDSVGTARQMLARKALDKVATVYDLNINAKDGRRVALGVSTRLIYADGEPVGVQGIARDITERKRAEAELLQRNQELAALNEIGQELSKLVEPAEIAKLIHTMIGKVMDNRNLYVALYDDQTQDVSFPAYTIDGDPYDSATRKFGRGLTEHIINTRQPLLIARDVEETLEQLGLVSSGRHAKCWLAVPMLVGEKVVGVITIQDYETPDAYDHSHVELLSTIASHAAIVVENARLYLEMKQQAERAALTNRISQAVRRTLDVSEVFETAVRELGKHLAVDRCSLFMKDEKAGRVTNAAEYHVPEVLPAGSDFDLPQVQGLNAAMEKHGVMAFDDVAKDERIRELYQGILKRMDVKSIMYVGVTVGDELLGALALSTTKAIRHWSKADIEVAKAAADQTGIAIRQAILYQKAEATSMREALANKLSVAIRASLSLPEVLDTTTRELGQALSASFVRVRLYDQAGNRSAIEQQYLSTSCESASEHDDDYEDILRQHFQKSQSPLVIADSQEYAEGSPEFSACLRASAARIGLRSQIDYPLTVSEKFRGVISIHQMGSRRRWTEDEVSLVESVAAQLATGIAQAELFEMVARAKKEWESTFDAMSDGIFIFDRSGHLIRVNRAGAAMDNASAGALLGRKCCDILRASNDGEQCIVEQALHDQGRINVEVMPQNLNRPVLVTVEPVLDESRQTIGAVCTARDLSELRKAEAVAREGQSLLKNILESAREAIYALDSEGRYKWCNQAMLEMTGYRLDEIIGHNFIERTHDDDREMRRERFAAALSGEPQTYESRYLARDGSVRYAAVNSAPIIVDGETTGVLGIAHDITEQKQERERAARADKLRALGQLASGVAHDFNNSLAAILGRAQLILRRVKDEELIRSLGIIVTAAEDAAATVRRIQTFARKSVDSELDLLDVGSLLGDAIEITRTRWQNEARAAGLNVDVTLDAGTDLFVRGNASELREVFVNLIVNAVDAMPQGGKLTICSQLKAGRVNLRFADTGTGMREEVRERVFEPFYTTKGVQGTGLGLAVSYGIIERHKGSISVESKPGRGTTFDIDLPVAEFIEAPPRESHPERQSPSLSVLVVDDEPFVRETLADMLLDLDHKVVTADCGRDALEKVCRDNFDLVFTDLAMPEMDGWETAREIHKHRPNLPIVLVTGYGATAQPPSGELDLVACIISKPFDFDQVTGTIGRVCSS
jgi:PAS domain S-box-containing protein